MDLETTAKMYKNGYLLIGLVNDGQIPDQESLWQHPLLKETGMPEDMLNQLLGLVEWRKVGRPEIGFPNAAYNHLSQFLVEALTYNYANNDNLQHNP